MCLFIILILLVKIKHSTELNQHILKIGFYKNITSKSCGLKSFGLIPQIPEQNKCFKWHKTVREQIQYMRIKSIKDGRFANDGEVPYTVYLNPAKGVDLTKHNLIVYAGIKVFQYPRDRKRLIKAEKVITHPRYNEDGLSTPDYDIGLIKLTEKIVPNDDIPDANTVCLPGNILPDRYHITKPSYALFSGWGYVDDMKANEERLKVVLVPINRYLGDLKITTKFEDLSFGHACKGDSGGPLVQYVNGHAVLIGVMAKITRHKSENNLMCGRVTEMKFASVTYHMDWIRDTILKNS